MMQPKQTKTDEDNDQERPVESEEGQKHGGRRNPAGHAALHQATQDEHGPTDAIGRDGLVGEQFRHPQRREGP